MRDNAGEDSGALPAALVRAELQRLLASDNFSRSPRNRRLLTYLVEQSLAGEGHRLKESVIGVEVFDRGNDYDPSADSIVRVAARKLRQNLREYYSREGRENPLRIDVPKGHYEAVFEQAPRPRSAFDPRKRLMISTVAITGVLAVVLLSAAAMFNSQADRVTPVASEPTRIAVGPTAVEGTDPALAHLAAAFDYEMQSDLADRGLRIVAPEAADAAYRLSARARHEGDANRISLVLLEAASGRRVWGTTLEAPALSSGIPGLPYGPLVTSAIEQLIGMDCERRDYEARGIAPPAIDAYLSGMTEIVELQLQIGGDWRAAERYLERARSIQPTWPSPYIRLIQIYASRLGTSIPPGDARAKVRSLSRELVSLEPKMSFMLAFPSLHLELDYPSTYRFLEQAEPFVEPADMLQNRCYLEFAQGKLGLALQYCQGAVESGPTPERRITLAHMLTFAGRYEDSIAMLEATLGLQKNSLDAVARAAMAYAEVFAGDLAAATRTVDHALADYRASAPELFVGPLALLGRTEEATSLLEAAMAQDLRGTNDIRAVTSLFYGLYFLGRTDEALVYLRRGIDEREVFLIGAMRTDPRIQSLRADPRFEELFAYLVSIETEAASSSPLTTIAMADTGNRYQ